MHIKNGVSSDTLASLQLAGNISEETLKKNVARFNKKVKDFKAKTRFSTPSGLGMLRLTGTPSGGSFPRGGWKTGDAITDNAQDWQQTSPVHFL